MSWLEEQLEGFVKWLLGWITDSLVELIRTVLFVLIEPIVRTPGPRGGDGWIAFGMPANPPWPALYTDVYLAFVVPLSLGLLFIALAYIAVRTGSLSPYRRQRLLKRVGIALGACFFWFPLASAGTHLFDVIGITIATGGGGTGELVADLDEALKVATGGVILVLVIYAVESFLILFAALVFAIRWIAIIVLTLLMPLLATLWVFEVWPLRQFAGIARKTAAAYPGLLIAGLPSALLIRIAVEAEFTFGFGGFFAVLISAALIPAAALASLVTIVWSNSQIRRVARSSATAGMATAAATPTARDAGKTAKRTARGARNVHRGLRGRRGALKADGTTAFGDGDSRAYRAGARARRVATAPGRNVRAGLTRGRSALPGAGDSTDSNDGQTGSAARDATATSSRTRTRLRRSIRRTKEKFKRW